MNSVLSISDQNLPDWPNEVISHLHDVGFLPKSVVHQEFLLLKSEKFKLVVHLVSIENTFNPELLITLQKTWLEKGFRLVHIWEDVWLTRSVQVKQRILSLLGLNTRIHGRQTKVLRIDKKAAETFMNTNHLQGAVNSRYKFGLYLKEELVAVATFSALRKMNHSADYYSSELIRFAVKAGHHVNGGLSKLIKHYTEVIKPNDLMTYADRDWSAGEAYIKLGFDYVSSLEPRFFELNEVLHRQSLANESGIPETKVVFNTGSLKYRLKF